MTFSAYEGSARGGSPVELYEFNIGGTFFRYTSSGSDYTYNGDLFTSEYIERSNIEKVDEINKSALDVKVSTLNEIVTSILDYPPATVIYLNVYRVHANDPDQEGLVIWAGRIISIERGQARVTFKCESVFTSLKRTGLVRTYQTMCPHLLYGTRCQLQKFNFLVSASLTAVSGINISAVEFDLYDDGYFNGGFIIFTNALGLPESRMITSHVGTDVSIDYIIPGLISGVTVSAYPGCDHSMTDCDTKFSNIANYGGFPYIPLINPFDSIVY